MSSPLSSPGSESGSLEFDCLDDGEMITSFSNPNYNPDEADAINSNLPLSEYYNDNNIYENVDSNTPLMGATDSKTNTSSKGRKKYAQLDLTSMGIEGGDESLTPLSQGDLNSPDSAFSLDSRYSNGSSVTTPSERATEIVEVEHTEEQQDDDMAPYAQMPGKGFLGYYASLERSAKSRQKDKVEEEAVEAEKLENEEKEEKVNLEEEAKEETKKDAQKKYDDKCKDINSPDSNDSGIQADVHHVRGPVNEDLYAVVTKSAKPPKPQVTEDLYAVVNKSAKLPKPPLQDKNKADDDDGDDDEEEEKKEEETEEGDEKEILPSGWEKCEDDDGAYYWHIKSGTIQREPPPPPGPDDKDRARPLSITSESSLTGSVSSPSVSEEKPVASEKTPRVEPEPIKTPPVVPPKQMEDHSLKSEKSASMKRGSIDAAGDKAIRFAVRSLGWVRIMEEDLTPERSSKAVNRCIVDLSLGRNDINDVVGRWGDGKDLYMDLDKRNLTLIDPQDMSVLNVQSIQSIRVWGVGRDNGRDFAYVARDRATRKHMCHVFRCDTPARQIANTLRDICKRIMVERSLQASTTSIQKMSISRPNHLPNLEKTTDTKSSKLTSSILQGSFPTPMEEPKKVLRCHYLGATNCQKATGVEILNNSLEKLHAQVPPEKWVFVNVAVAPSTITITEYGNSERQLVECRVRFLSFMGIAMRNVKLCGFIVHTAQDQYVAHVFHCEPSAGAVCKTIEAACKLRYQKCLDAHPTSPDTLMKQNMQQQQAKGLSATLKAGVQNVFGKLKKRTGAESSGS